MASQRKNILILFFTLVVIMLGFGMVIPIMPFYIKSLGASGSDLGMLMAIFGITQFLFAPVWGQLSDRVGRKKILMLGVLGNAVAQLFFGLSSELWMLFASRALAGILSSATLPTAMAYISDSTSEKERGGGMGAIGAAFGIGMVLGPGLAGWLAVRSLSLPFFIASGLSLVALVLVFLVLPESLPPEKRAHAEGKLRGPKLSALWQALTGPMGFLYFMVFMLSFGLTNFESVFGLYAAQRYEYGPQVVGWILTMVGFASAFMQGVLTGPLIRRWGESNVIRVCLASTSVGFLLMLQASSLLAVSLTVCYFVVSNSMLYPATSSLISKRATGGQGITMGLNNSFQSLGRIAGPLWAGFVFDINMSYPYLTGSAIMMLAFFLSLFRLTQQPLETSEAGYSPE